MLRSHADIVIQYSTDGFATPAERGTVVKNTQGFPVVPYGFTTYFCGSPVQVRAFQAHDASESWSSGDPTGRYDRTSDGNATYLNLTAGQSGVDIAFDGTTAQ